MLNSAEHEILNAHKYKNIKKFCIFQAQISLECYFLLLINVKMPTIVGILTFMSRKNFMLSWVEHEKSFITPGYGVYTGRIFEADLLLCNFCIYAKYCDNNKSRSKWRYAV